MHVFVPALVIEKHEHKLLLGKVCTFCNFCVKDYRTDEKFRCIQADRQMIITNYTQVQKLDEDDLLIPKNMFNFYDMSDLDSIANDNLYLTGILHYFKLSIYVKYIYVQIFNLHILNHEFIQKIL